MLHTSLADASPFDVLRLIRSENVGAVTFFQLVKRYGSPAKALDALPELANRGGLNRPIRIASKTAVESELEKAEKYGAKLLLYGQSDYPALLHEIHDAPPLLMLRGSAQLWKQRRCVAIVGSRNASAGGCSLTRKLARDCGEMGLVVVSGLARGIDAAAHQGALASGTVGVIAGGIDTIYPPENLPLYNQLAETGAILSEQPFGSAPHSRSFPGRNRIIAGMCEGLLVVEATPKSGSLISASYALEQGREVMAIPGSPLDPRSHGTNGLIKQGAILIETAEDIFRALQQPIRNISSLSGMQEPPLSSNSQMLAEPSEIERQKAYQLLLKTLGPVPVHIDAIARETEISIALLQGLVLELELAGRVLRSAGGKIALNYTDIETSDTALPRQANLL